MMATPEELYVCFQREESKVRRRQTIEPRQPDYSIDWFKGVGRHELQLTWGVWVCVHLRRCTSIIPTEFSTGKSVALVCLAIDAILFLSPHRTCYKYIVYLSIKPNSSCHDRCVTYFDLWYYDFRHASTWAADCSGWWRLSMFIYSRLPLPDQANNLPAQLDASKMDGDAEKIPLIHKFGTYVESYHPTPTLRIHYLGQNFNPFIDSDFSYLILSLISLSRALQTVWTLYL